MFMPSQRRCTVLTLTVWLEAEAGREQYHFHNWHDVASFWDIKQNLFWFTNFMYFAPGFLIINNDTGQNAACRYLLIEL